MNPVAPPVVDWNARIRLALSILSQRDPDEHAAEQAVMALRGWTVDAIARYAASEGRS